jgi:hypothetical protein
MKKASLSQFTIPENSQLVLHDLNTFQVKVKPAKGKRKNIFTDTLLLAMLTKDLAHGEYISFINPPLTAPYLKEEAPAVQRYNLELQIKDRSKAFNKAAAKYNRLEEKGKILEKKKMDIEGKIQKNQHDLQTRIMEVEAKKHLLAVSFTQRENNKMLQQST